MPPGGEENIFYGGFRLIALLVGLFISGGTAFLFYTKEVAPTGKVTDEAEGTSYVAPGEGGAIA